MMALEIRSRQERITNPWMRNGSRISFYFSENPPIRFFAVIRKDFNDVTDCLQFFDSLHPSTSVFLNQVIATQKAVEPTFGSPRYDELGYYFVLFMFQMSRTSDFHQTFI